MVKRKKHTLHTLKKHASYGWPCAMICQTVHYCTFTDNYHATNQVTGVLNFELHQVHAHAQLCSCMNRFRSKYLSLRRILYWSLNFQKSLLETTLTGVKMASSWHRVGRAFRSNVKRFSGAFGAKVGAAVSQIPIIVHLILFTLACRMPLSASLGW